MWTLVCNCAIGYYFPLELFALSWFMNDWGDPVSASHCSLCASVVVSTQIFTFGSLLTMSFFFGKNCWANEIDVCPILVEFFNVQCGFGVHAFESLVAFCRFLFMCSTLLVCKCL